MASVVTKFARKCQILENSVFYLGGKKKKSRKKSQKIVKMLYFDIAAKDKKKCALSHYNRICYFRNVILVPGN